MSRISYYLTASAPFVYGRERGEGTIRPQKGLRRGLSSFPPWNGKGQNAWPLRELLCSGVFQCQFHPCYPGVKCVNTAPGYRCDACPMGYTGMAIEGVGVLFAQTNKQASTERGCPDLLLLCSLSLAVFLCCCCCCCCCCCRRVAVIVPLDVLGSAA